MSNTVDPELKCEDFLKDNPRLYAHKARRKKIALISVEVANRDLGEIRIEIGATKLVVGERVYNVESPELIIKKFSEFTWDFLIYSILDFHPLLAIVDAFLFLTGPLYNRRLRKQLHLLADGELVLGRDELKKVLLGFRGVPRGAAQLFLFYRREDGERRQLTCCFGQSAR